MLGYLFNYAHFLKPLCLQLLFYFDMTSENSELLAVIVKITSIALLFSSVVCLPKINKKQTCN